MMTAKRPVATGIAATRAAAALAALTRQTPKSPVPPHLPGFNLPAVPTVSDANASAQAPVPQVSGTRAEVLQGLKLQMQQLLKGRSTSATLPRSGVGSPGWDSPGLTSTGFSSAGRNSHDLNSQNPNSPDPSLHSTHVRATFSPDFAAGGGDSSEVTSTGVAGLDVLLPLRGVPRGGMVEWLVADMGAGAATLALAGVRQALSGTPPHLMRDGCFGLTNQTAAHHARAAVPSRDANQSWDTNQNTNQNPDADQPSLGARGGRWVVIDPLRQFFPPAALGWGILPEQLLLVQPASERDAAWAFEQALRCPGVAVTWNWIGSATERMLQRWKIAAEVGGGQGVLFRSDRALKQAAWADIRWLVQPLVDRGARGRRFRLKLVYCRGALGGDQVEVECNDETGAVCVVPQLADSATHLSAARA